MYSCFIKPSLILLSVHSVHYNSSNTVHSESFQTPPFFFTFSYVAALFFNCLMKRKNVFSPHSIHHNDKAEPEL